MTIKGTELLGNWGKKTPVNENVHITQTNSNSRDGEGVHITTEIPGSPIKIHDRFDKDGNYLGSNFAKR